MLCSKPISCWSHNYNVNTWTWKKTFCVLIIILQIMISNGLDFIRFAHNFQFGDILQDYYIFSFLSFSIYLVIAVAFNLIFSLNSLLHFFTIVGGISFFVFRCFQVVSLFFCEWHHIFILVVILGFYWHYTQHVHFIFCNIKFPLFARFVTIFIN